MPLFLGAALQMVPKWATPTNPFAGATGVISRPYKWLDLKGGSISSCPYKYDL
jgi:hypothetical protein